jgi:hypothetical protein
MPEENNAAGQQRRAKLVGPTEETTHREELVSCPRTISHFGNTTLGPKPMVSLLRVGESHWKSVAPDARVREVL